MTTEEIIKTLYDEELVTELTAEEIDDSRQSPELLAREAGALILDDVDDKPIAVCEMATGFAVLGDTHVAYIGNEGETDIDARPDDVANEAKKRYAMIPGERKKDCKHEMGFAYQGRMPGTGPRVCRLCGTRLDDLPPKERKKFESAAEGNPDDVDEAVTRRGLGVGGQRQGTGGTDTCECPKCGATAPHVRGIPCSETKCPKCGTPMQGMNSESAFDELFVVAGAHVETTDDPDSDKVARYIGDMLEAAGAEKDSQYGRGWSFPDEDIAAVMVERCKAVLKSRQGDEAAPFGELVEVTHEYETDEDGEPVFVDEAGKLPPRGTLYVDNSSIFDSPANKYDIKLFQKTLKDAGAKKVWAADKYGWGNLPAVVLFQGLGVKKAQAALDELPVFKKRGAVIHDAHAHWKEENEGDMDEAVPGIVMYMKRVPTTDSLRHSVPELKSKKDLAYFSDKACKHEIARIAWDATKSMPRRGAKTVMYNCARYKAVWVDESDENEEVDLDALETYAAGCLPLTREQMAEYEEVKQDDPDAAAMFLLGLADEEGLEEEIIAEFKKMGAGAVRRRAMSAKKLARDPKHKRALLKRRKKFKRSPGARMRAKKYAKKYARRRIAASVEDESVDETKTIGDFADALMGGKPKIKTAWGSKTRDGVFQMLQRTEKAVEVAGALLNGREFISTAWGKKSADGIVDAMRRLKEGVEVQMVGYAAEKEDAELVVRFARSLGLNAELVTFTDEEYDPDLLGVDLVMPEWFDDMLAGLAEIEDDAEAEKYLDEMIGNPARGKLGKLRLTRVTGPGSKSMKSNTAVEEAEGTKFMLYVAKGYGLEDDIKDEVMAVDPQAEFTDDDEPNCLRVTTAASRDDLLKIDGVMSVGVVGPTTEGEESHPFLSDGLDEAHAFKVPAIVAAPVGDIDQAAARKIAKAVSRARGRLTDFDKRGKMVYFGALGVTAMKLQSIVQGVAKGAKVTVVREGSPLKEESDLDEAAYDIKKLKHSGDKKEDWFMVKDAVGKVLGFLTKFKPVPGETHPWKAFAPIVGQGRPHFGKMIKAFYKRDGGKKAALVALAKNESVGEVAVNEAVKWCWVRIGDGSDYEKYDDPSEVVDMFVELGVTPPLRWRSGGFECSAFKRNNYVSMYWGDNDADKTRDLNRREQKAFEKALAVAGVNQGESTDEAKWSADVKTKWHPREGFFKQPADKIASGLKKASKSVKQAMNRLNFYINRAGDNLDPERKAALEKAKAILSTAVEAEDVDEAIRKNLSVPEKHQLKIAKSTLRMSDTGALVMGGMNKEEARAFLKRIGYSGRAIAKMEEAEDVDEARPLGVAMAHDLGLKKGDNYYDAGTGLVGVKRGGLYQWYRWNTQKQKYVQSGSTRGREGATKHVIEDFDGDVDEGFSGDSDAWFDRISGKGGNPKLLAFAKKAATRENFEAFHAAVKDPALKKQCDAIAAGKYRKEFRFTFSRTPQQSSVVKELFSFYRQAATYNESVMEERVVAEARRRRQGDRLWLGVAGGWDDYGEDFSALADAIKELRIRGPLRWHDGGFETSQGTDISLFWGDEDASRNADLTKSERRQVEKGLKESVQISFPRARIRGFLEIARKSGVDDDNSEVVVDEDQVTVRVDAEAAEKIQQFFKGDDVTVGEATRYPTRKKPGDSTYSAKWSGVTGGKIIKGKVCARCGGKVHKEGGSAYCPDCDDYVQTRRERTDTVSVE